MARAHLGAVIDIHTGGEDNAFPHHECEIAQSWGAAEDSSAPKVFAHTWVHGRHLLVHGRKMSKSDGTFFTLRDLLDPRGNGRPEVAERLEPLGFIGGKVTAAILRYALLSNAYTQPMNFSVDLLVQSKASLERLQSRYDRLREVAPPEGVGEASERAQAIIAAGTQGFHGALADNLNMPNALAALFDAVCELNQLDLSPADATAALALFESVDAVLDVLDRRPRSGLITAEKLAARVALGGLPLREELGAMTELGPDAIEALAAARKTAREAKDYAFGDAIRDHLKQQGVVIEDTAQGIRWKRA
jgi:cysteinyl-tRNA synthetase